MVSSDQVRSSLENFRLYSRNYSKGISDLSTFWQGESYENFLEKSEAFSSEYFSSIENQVSAFSSACGYYERYKVAQTNKKISENNLQKAINYSDTANISRFEASVQAYSEEELKYKSLIIDQLIIAASYKLAAIEEPVSVQISSSSGASSSGTQSGSGSSTPVSVTGLPSVNGNVIDTSSPMGTGTKYNLSDDEIAYLAYVAYREQGSVSGAKIELSLMCNLYEKNKSKYSSVVDYVKNSGWFAKSSTRNYSYPGDSYVEAARAVLADGERYLPSNVDEHDCISDITSISTGSKSNRSDYIPGETIIYSTYGAKYVFVGFAPNGGDPFGYLVR